MSTRYTRAADKELNDKHTKILLELLQKPENKQCADCKKKDPRWASWNLGIFICIRCSGTHRSLGTHISKVKSVDLDTWIPEQIESMVSIGNEKANTYWEARLNGRLPSDSNIDAWIRAKYQHKKWIKDGPVNTEVDTPKVSENVTQQEPKIDTVQQQPKDTRLQELQDSILKAIENNDEKENIKTSKVEVKPEIKTSPVLTPIAKKPYQTKSLAANSLKTDKSPIDFSSFQQQLSGLSAGQTNSGLIPKAPPGSNQSWTNFLNGQPNDISNNVLSQPSTEKPLIPLDAFANLLKQ